MNRRRIIGFVFIILGLVGLVWWHGTLSGSGGMDDNRNVLQYLVPYGVFILLTLVGVILSAKRGNLQR
ncbi:hypothetical protein [Pseudalkalibacillus sp. SCS-8]|uniref:hypothetical protein n=1 Tax=Pseudalkalibacillus nanhaiensis TaxID=3115291 RepID=UPI0032DB3EBE